jgi:succinate dehydrogenase / fumarate reductase membrane anchor subunit
MTQMRSDSGSIKVMRSPLALARGLGAAKSGVEQWWLERVTSVALVPLTLWFVYAVLHLSGRSRADVAHFVGHPFNAALLLALVLITFRHMQMGLQVVIEDYVHVAAARLVGLLAVKGLALVIGLASAIAVLKLAVSG